MKQDLKQKQRAVILFNFVHKVKIIRHFVSSLANLLAGIKYFRTFTFD